MRSTSSKTKWGFYVPKGQLKNYETPERAALREIKEELTLNRIPKLVGKIGISDYSFHLPGDERPHYKIVHLFVYKLTNKAKIHPEKKENFIDARWFTFDEAINIIAFDREYLIRAKNLYVQRRNG
ncbi:MAG TPA: NUDIX domain-containing protein [Anaerolineaceae bacterium]|nr:NUDIX domain-containing protein [Anaerolineaceae bacterium]